MQVLRLNTIHSYLTSLCIAISGCLLSIHGHTASSASEYFQSGLHYLEQQNYVQARTHFLNAVSSEPINPKTLGMSYYHLAQTCFHLKEYKMADQYAQQSVIYFKDAPLKLANAYELVGKINFYEKQYTKAERAFLLTLQSHPKKESRHFMYLAKTYIKSKKLDDAIEVLDLAISQFGDLQSFHDKAFELELKLYRYEDAMHRVEYLIAGGKRPIHNLIKLGELHQYRGNLGKAKAAFSQASTLFHNLPIAKKNSAYMKQLSKTIQTRMSLAGSP